MLDHVVVVVVILFVLYVAGKVLRPVADFYGAVLGPVGAGCHKVKDSLDRSSAAPEGAQSGTHPGLLAVIARLVGLVLGLAVLAGEFFGSWAAIRIFFGNEAGAAPLPAGGLAGPTLAVLVFAICTVFGMLLLEAMEFVPTEVRIFNVPDGRRIAFQWFAGVSFIASVGAMALYWAIRALYLGDPSTTDMTAALDTAAALKLPTFVLIGVLVSFAGLVSLWLVVIGLQAVVQLLASVASTVAGVLVVVVDSLGGQFRRPGVHETGYDGDGIPVHPVAENGGVAMTQEWVGVYGGGSFWGQMAPKMEEAMKRLRAAHLVRSSGGVNLDHLLKPMSIGQDVSPMWEDRERILADAVNPGQGYTAIFDRLAVGIHDANVKLPSTGASVWFFLDRDTIPFALDMLRTVKRQHPYHTIVVVTQLDEDEPDADMAGNGLRSLRKLWEEDVIATTFVFSSRSPFVMTVKQSGGAIKQLEFIAQTLVAVMLAGTHTHSTINRSCVEIIKALGRLSPFVGCALASERLSPLQMSGVRALVQWMRRDERTMGDCKDLRGQAEHVAEQVLTQSDYQAIEVKTLPDRRALLVCTVPLREGDRRLASVQESLNIFLAKSFRTVGSVVVRGNGIPMDITTDPLDRWYVQVSCVYALPVDFFEHGGAELEATRGQKALPGAPTKHLVADSQAGDLPASNGVGQPRVL